MLERYEIRVQEYRRRIRVATAVTLSLQALVLVLAFRSGWSPVPVPDRVHLGYPGPNVVQPELEVLEPNSVQAYFYQKAREGRSRAIEYRILQPVEFGPGPQPLLVPDVAVEEKPRPEVEPAPEEYPDVVVPLFSTHADIAYSEDFQILKMVKPRYPEYELSRGIRARLLVAVWVTPLGDVDGEKIQEAVTDPPTASPRGFELATLEAVRQWKVRPPQRMLGTRGMWLTIPVQFDPTREKIVDFEGLRPR